MPFENLLVETRERIQYITVNRESRMNALNKATIAELHTAFYDAFINPKVGGVIITGAGPKAFVAGADIGEFANVDMEGGAEIARRGQTLVFDLIENGSKPVIAAINGFALGGGLELAMACHLRVASDNAKMGLPEVTLGLMPGYGGSQRLPQLVGKGRAMELILTGDMITAAQAHQFGLVNHVVKQEELIAKAEELMNKILSRGPLAISSAISAVNAGFKECVNGYEVEISEFGKCFGTKDLKEGISAFLEKRPPHFKGE